ncbi:MAG: homocitrate synthase [Firmicutes bacterium]|nr:homocitrate synthase [Bacillota bacterium]
MHIVDNTLTNCWLTPAAAFSLREKASIARMLDFIGVDIIEAGIPGMNEKERASVLHINSLGLRARIVTWNRISLGDIRASLACGVKDIYLSAPVSDLLIRYKTGNTRQWVLDCTKRVLRYAGDYGCSVSVGAEDASRADIEFVEELALLAQEMGAKRFRFADTAGVLEPVEVLERLIRLGEKLKIELEFQGCDVSGKAAANSVVAVKAGVRYISTVVGLPGERAGSTDLKRFIGMLKLILGYYPDLRFNMINKLERYVARATSRNLRENVDLYRTGNA